MTRFAWNMTASDMDKKIGGRRDVRVRNASALSLRSCPIIGDDNARSAAATSVMMASCFALFRYGDSFHQAFKSLEIMDRVDVRRDENPPRVVQLVLDSA